MKLQAKSHYFVIARSLVDGKYFITNMLYSSEEEARKDLGSSFHRLWLDGPKVELNAVVELKPRPAEKQESFLK